MKRTLIILCFISTSLSSFCQSGSLPNPEAYFSAIIVNDIYSSIDWYSRIFGFKVLNQIDLEERGIKQANLKRGDTMIELIELSTSLSPSSLLKDHPKKARIEGFFKFGFKVSQFDKWVDHLTQSGVEFNGSVVEDKLSGKRMLIVNDPDGNRIQIFEK